MTNIQSHQDHIAAVAREHPELKAWVAVQNLPLGLQVFIYDLRISPVHPVYAFGILNEQIAQMRGMSPGAGYILTVLNWSEFQEIRPPLGGG